MAVVFDDERVLAGAGELRVRAALGGAGPGVRTAAVAGLGAGDVLEQLLQVLGVDVVPVVLELGELHRVRLGRRPAAAASRPLLGLGRLQLRPQQVGQVEAALGARPARRLGVGPAGRVGGGRRRRVGAPAPRPVDGAQDGDGRRRVAGAVVALRRVVGAAPQADGVQQRIVDYGAGGGGDGRVALVVMAGVRSRFFAIFFVNIAGVVMRYVRRFLVFIG